MLDTEKGHMVGERHVYTWGKPWPLGCLTGYVNRAGGFVLEHVIAFPGSPKSTLVNMVSAGLEEAWERHYPYVVFFLPANHPNYAGLSALGTRLKFREYGHGWWVTHRASHVDDDGTYHKAIR